MRLFSLFLVMIVVTGCKYGGIGMPGSPAWKATASPQEKALYYNDLASEATMVCRDMGIPEQQLSGCVQQQLLQQQENSARIKESAMQSWNNYWEGRQRINQQTIDNYNAMRPRHTNCNAIGSSINCTTY